MHHPFTLRRCCLALLLTMSAAGTVLAESGKELFEKQCSGCHTIGGGDGGGPDLKGVVARHSTDWLVRIITEPDKLTSEKDPAQLELVKKFGSEMPNLGVSGDDARKIVSFLQEGAVPAAAGNAPSAGAAPAASAPGKEVPSGRELISSGADLFTGRTPFAKGGPPCVSCHALHYRGIYGGALAADLTGMYAKMGESGVRGVLKGLSFPVMKKAFADRPLSEEEIAALTALFKDASEKPEPAVEPYPVAGLCFFALLIVAAIVYKRRIS